MKNIKTNSDMKPLAKSNLKDIKNLLKKKEKKSVSVIRNVSRSYLSVEEIII